MSKYIDADRLKAEIGKHIKEVMDAAARFTPNMGFFDAKLSGIYDVIAIIDSQQEQLPGIEEHGVLGIEEHGVLGKDFIPVDWVDACEKYGKWKIIQQEQPDVDLEKEIQEYLEKLGGGHGGFVDDLTDDDLMGFALHFYELGQCNARKEEQK